MSEADFFERLQNNPRPVVVDFWAPWCGPCRMIEPALKTLDQQYSGQVDLWKINADEQPEVLRALKIYSIPTLIAYQGGHEVGRHTGAASRRGLQALFEAARTGDPPRVVGMAPLVSIIRLITAALLLWLAFASDSLFRGVLLGLAGAALLISAAFDLFPIYKALRGWLQERRSR